MVGVQLYVMIVLLSSVGNWEWWCYLSRNSYYYYLLKTGREVGLSAGDGAQGRPAQSVPLVYMDCIELKTIWTQKIQKNLFASPLTAWKSLNRVSGPDRKLSPEITTKGMGHMW